MFRGFATVSFYADDLAAARDWYTELLGFPPYYAYPAPPPRRPIWSSGSATTATSSASSTAGTPRPARPTRPAAR